MKKHLRKISAMVMLSAAIIGGVWFATPSEASCSDFNVVRCGTPTHQSLKQTYYSQSGIRQLYNQYRITDAMINGANMKRGVVDANGTITVEGRVVATGARTLQGKAGTRQVRPEATPTVAGRTYYQYTTAQSFIDGITRYDVFAWFDNDGKFIAGIIGDCGNPVWGTPTPPPAKPVLTCDALTAKKIGRATFQFTAKATAKNGATINNYTYNFGDGTKKTAGAEYTHAYSRPGSYTITVAVNGNANGAVTKDSQTCRTTVTVEAEPTDRVCHITSGKIITIKQSEFDSKIHSRNLKDCEMTVCELNTGNIITINKDKFDSKIHGDVSDCEVERCHIPSKKIVKLQRKDVTSEHTTDYSKCAPAPVTPPTPPVTPPTPPVVSELPRTGADLIMPVLGLGALTTVGLAYTASRRHL
ncbi:MAG: PKD domain-containing protein [Candidatus Saccharibacteria bacterium]|nr:PKD domain-containing protein [Candidatus Saccharibacteria bacterium]